MRALAEAWHAERRALFDRTVEPLLQRARKIDPHRAADLVKATYEAVLFGQVSYPPKRRSMLFLSDVMLRLAGVPRPSDDPSKHAHAVAAGS